MLEKSLVVNLVLVDVVFESKGLYACINLVVLHMNDYLTVFPLDQLEKSFSKSCGIFS